MSRFYEDIGKESNDLIYKGFPADSVARLIVDTKTPNGISVNATTRRALKNNNEVVDVAIETKYDWKDRNVEASTKFTTTDTYEGSVSLKEPGSVIGSKLTVTGVSNGGNVSLKGGLSYRNENLAVKGNVQYPLSEGAPIVVSGSTVVQYPKSFFWGADVNYSLPHGSSERSDKGKGPTMNWNAAAGWADESGTQLHAYMKNAAAAKDAKVSCELGIGWIQRISDSVKFAFDFNMDANQIRDPAATIAGEYKYDSLTTLKSKLLVRKVKSTDFRLGLAASHKLSSNLSATIGSDLNMSQLLGSNTGNPHTFGFELKFQ